MSVITFTGSVTSSIPAAKLFKVLYVDHYSCLAKAAPQIIKSVKKIQGSGGAGTILQFNFAEGTLAKYTKSRIAVLDEDNLSYAETILEGGELFDKIELATYEIKVESTPNGGSINKTVVKYHLKDGAELAEGEFKPSIEEFHALLKAVEAYVLANNPNV